MWECVSALMPETISVVSVSLNFLEWHSDHTRRSNITWFAFTVSRFTFPFLLLPLLLKCAAYRLRNLT